MGLCHKNKMEQEIEQNKEQEISQPELSENPSNNGKKIVMRNEKGQLEKGSILNPKGKPQGTKHFNSLMDEAVKDIARINKIPESEVWQILIKKGYAEAKNGNYPFFKDLLDRYFGKPKERIGFGIDDESVGEVEIKIIKK